MTMNVIDRRKNLTPFGDLEIGDCFTVCESLFIKIEPHNIGEKCDPNPRVINAVELDSGLSVWFDNTEKVRDITSLRIEIL